MKKVISLIYALDAQATTGTTSNEQVKPESTSPALLAIREAMNAKFAEVQKATDMKAALALNTELFKLQQDEKSEIAAIAKAEKDAELEVKRNERAKLVTDFEAAAIADATLQASKASKEDKEKSKDALTAQRDALTNELLGRLAASSPSKTATGNTATGTKGAIAADIRSAFVANRAAGMTDTANIKAIIESGFSRGTTGAVVLAYQREIGEKA